MLRSSLVAWQLHSDFEVRATVVAFLTTRQGTGFSSRNLKYMKVFAEELFREQLWWESSGTNVGGKALGLPGVARLHRACNAGIMHA